MAAGALEGAAMSANAADSWIVIDVMSEVFVETGSDSKPPVVVKLHNQYSLSGVELDVMTRLAHPNLLSGHPVTITDQGRKAMARCMRRDAARTSSDDADSSKLFFNNLFRENEKATPVSRAQFVAALVGMKEIRSPARFTDSCAIAMRAGIPFPTYLEITAREKTPDARHRLLCDVARGLAHMISNGYVHGDVKPDNILIVDGRAQIADFGLTRYAGTKANGCRGWIEYEWQTPTYRHPSDYSVLELVDYDYWAFGVVVAEVSAHCHPYWLPGDDWTDMSEVVRAAKFPEEWTLDESVAPSETVASDWPEAVREICRAGGGPTASRLGLTLPPLGRGPFSPPAPTEHEEPAAGLVTSLARSLAARVNRLAADSECTAARGSPLAYVRGSTAESIRQCCRVLAVEYYGRSYYEPCLSLEEYLWETFAEAAEPGDFDAKKRLMFSIGDVLGWRYVGS